MQKEEKIAAAAAKRNTTLQQNTTMAQSDRGENDCYTAVTSRLPSGSVIAVVSASRDAAREYLRPLRQAGISGRWIEVQTDIQALRRIELDDDVRMLVAVGGNAAADCAKWLGHTHARPVFVAVTAPFATTVLDGYCAVREKGICKVLPCAAPVDAALLEGQVTAAPSELPDAFGGICAVAVSLFDREAYARAVGDARQAIVREQAFDVLFALLDEVAEGGRSNPALPFLLAKTSLALARLSQTESVGFVRGSADDCARLAARLWEYEGREPLGQGEGAFIFGSVLCRMYRAFMQSPPLAFLPPPDNNLRAEKLSEYLGLDDFSAARTAVRRVQCVELAAYRMHEYSDELCEVAGEAERVFDAAARWYKRLYADDGYGLQGVVDASDVRTVVALTPDFFPVFGTALTLLREFGVLERYL